MDFRRFAALLFIAFICIYDTEAKGGRSGGRGRGRGRGGGGGGGFLKALGKLFGGSSKSNGQIHSTSYDSGSSSGRTHSYGSSGHDSSPNYGGGSSKIHSSPTHHVSSSPGWRYGSAHEPGFSLFDPSSMHSFFENENKKFGFNPFDLSSVDDFFKNMNRKLEPNPSDMSSVLKYPKVHTDHSDTHPDAGKSVAEAMHEAETLIQSMGLNKIGFSPFLHESNPVVAKPSVSADQKSSSPSQDSKPHSNNILKPLQTNPSHIGFRPEVMNGAGDEKIQTPHSLILGAPPHIQPHSTLYPVQLEYTGSYEPQPFIPGQRIILPGHSNSDPDLGETVREALVRSAVDAGVRRIYDGPQHHYYHHSHQSDSSISHNQSAGANSTVTNNTTIIHSNYGSLDHEQGMPDLNLENAPLSPAEAVSNSSESNTANLNVTATSEVPALPLEYYISEDELMNLTESLFAKEELNLQEYTIFNLQKEVRSGSLNDEAPDPLMSTLADLYNIPTVRALKNMFDNYEINSTLKEIFTADIKREEDLLLDTFFNTDVMATALKWLTNKYYIETDDFEMKEALRNIWFNKIEGSTCGFERIFLAEIYPGSNLLGAQNWIYFASKEDSKDINYMGFVEERNITDKAKILKLNFNMADAVKQNGTMLMGTSPELEMALYTVCFYTRPNDICPISLGGNKFYIYTHAFRYSGKDLIDMGTIVF